MVLLIINISAIGMKEAYCELSDFKFYLRIFIHSYTALLLLFTCNLNRHTRPQGIYMSCYQVGAIVTSVLYGLQLLILGQEFECNIFQL